MVLIFLIVVIFLFIKGLDPIVVIFVPLLIACYLYSLQLSSFYHFNLSDLLVIYSGYLALFIGYYLVSMSSSKFNKLKSYYSRSITSIQCLKLIKIISFLGILVFAVESFIVTPPLLSDTPTFNYMSFGLPVLHHFIGLLKINAFLSVILYRNTGRLKHLVYPSLVAIAIFVLIMARLMVIEYLIILIITNWQYTTKNISLKKVVYLLLFGFLCWVFFVQLGNIRTGNLSRMYLEEITGVTSVVPDIFIFPYMYLTVGIQNMVNLINSVDSFGYGSVFLSDVIPLVNLEGIAGVDGLERFRVHKGLTTFIFGAGFYRDFGVFFLVPMFIVGCGIKYFHLKVDKNLFYGVVYYCYIFPSIMLFFFTDSFVDTQLLIGMVFAYYINKKTSGESIITN